MGWGLSRPQSHPVLLRFFVLSLILFAAYRGLTLQFAIEAVEFDGYELTMFVTDFSVPGWIEWVRRVALAAVISMSLYVLVFFSFAPASKRIYILFLFMILWRLFLTVVQAVSQDWQLSYLFEQISLTVLFCSSLMLLGYKEDVWSILAKLYASLAIPISILVLLLWILLPSGSRAEGIRDFRGFVYLVSVVGAFPLAVFGFSGIARRSLALLPCLAWIALAVATATRAMFLYLITFLVFLFVLNAFRIGVVKRVGIAAFIVFGTIAIWIYSDFLLDASGAFGGRVSEDTRSEQLYTFFQKIELYEFVFGSPSAGHDPRFSDDLNRWGIDSGFACILYLGGLPLLWLYFSLHFFAPVKLLARRMSLADTVVVAVALSAGIQMISSEMPSMTEGYLGLLPLLGRCLFLYEKQRVSGQFHRFGGK